MDIFHCGHYVSLIELKGESIFEVNWFPMMYLYSITFSAKEINCIFDDVKQNNRFSIHLFQTPLFWVGFVIIVSWLRLVTRSILTVVIYNISSYLFDSLDWFCLAKLVCKLSQVMFELFSFVSECIEVCFKRITVNILPIVLSIVYCTRSIPFD